MGLTSEQLRGGTLCAVQFRRGGWMLSLVGSVSLEHMSVSLEHESVQTPEGE